MLRNYLNKVRCLRGRKTKKKKQLITDPINLFRTPGCAFPIGMLTLVQLSNRPLSHPFRQPVSHSVNIVVNRYRALFKNILYVNSMFTNMFSRTHTQTHTANQTTAFAARHIFVCCVIHCTQHSFHCCALRMC